MKRLLKSTYGDMYMQVKYGFYTVYAVISIIYVLILRQLPDKALIKILPVLIFSDPSFLGFYFISGLVLLEKGENILEYLIVTPLRVHEYLISKIISLTVIALAASLVISLLTYGIEINIILFLIGIALTSILFILIGFIAVSKFSTINEYIMSSMVYIAILSIPMIGYFGLYKSKLFYIFPTQASLLLIKGAFIGLDLWNTVYAILYLILCIYITYKWAFCSFYKFIILKEGVK